MRHKHQEQGLIYLLLWLVFWTGTGLMIFLTVGNDEPMVLAAVNMVALLHLILMVSTHPIGSNN